MTSPSLAAAVALAKRTHSCPVVRVCYIETGATIDILSGKSTPPTGGEWKAMPCGTPLFVKNDGKRPEECDSCSKRWTHPHNFRVEFFGTDLDIAIEHRNLVHRDGSDCPDGCGGAL